MGSIQLRGRTAAQWAADNNILLARQPGVETDTGQMKIGDGVTAWNSLDYVGVAGAATWGAIGGTLSNQTDLNTSLAAKADRESELLTGGVISIGSFGGGGSNNDIRVTASTYYIVGNGNESAAQTDFLDIALASSGTQKYVGIYGQTDGTLVKVEGSEAALATFPATPANTCLFGYVLVSDAAITTTVDLTGYLLKSDKATAASVAARTEDDEYVTPYSLRFVVPQNNFLAAQFQTSSNVLVDITGMSISLTPGSYWIEAQIVMDTHPTGGSEVSYVFPTGTNKAVLRATINDMITRHFGYETTTVTHQQAGAGFGGGSKLELYAVVSSTSTFKLQVRSLTGGNTTSVEPRVTYIKVLQVA